MFVDLFFSLPTSYYLLYSLCKYLEYIYFIANSNRIFIYVNVFKKLFKKYTFHFIEL